MKTRGKMYIAGTICIGAGILFAAGGILAGGRPGVAIGPDGIHMAGDSWKEICVLEKTPLEDFSSAEIFVKHGDFSLIPSDGYYLEYQLEGEQEPSFQVQEGTFTFQERPMENDLQFGIFFWDMDITDEACYVKLYVPEDVFFESFVLNQESGNLLLGACRAEDLSIYLESGQAQIQLAEDPSEYHMELKTEYGSIQAPDVGTIRSEEGETSFYFAGSTEKRLSVYSESGDILVTSIR